MFSTTNTNQKSHLIKLLYLVKKYVARKQLQNWNCDWYPAVVFDCIIGLTAPIIYDTSKSHPYVDHDRYRANQPQNKLDYYQHVPWSELLIANRLCHQTVFNKSINYDKLLAFHSHVVTSTTWRSHDHHNREYSSLQLVVYRL